MRRKTRGAALAAIATVSLLATACGGGATDSGQTADQAAGEAGGEIVVRGCTPQEALIPANTTETCGGNIIDLLNAKLIHYNVDTAEPELDMAESIETEDEQNWTVTLKEGLTFHDGTPVTASSFVDAWNYAAYAPNGMQAGYFMEPIEGFADLQCGEEADCEATQPKAEEMSGLTVVDDRTFEIKTTAPVANLQTRLGYSAFAPMPQAFFDDQAAFEANPVGAGPYKFVSEDTQNIVVAKVDEYTGDWAGQADQITFRIYQDVAAAYADLVAGQLDVLDEVPTDMLVGDQWISDTGDRNVLAEEGVAQYLAFSPADEQLQDANKRKALSMAINRQEIVDQVFAGSRTPADTWASPVVDGYQEGVCGDTCEFQAEEAKRLWDEAGGYDGTLTLTINGDADHKPWADATCNSIKNTLDTECQVVLTPDFATFLDKMENRELQGMFRYGWQMDYPSLENFLTPIFATNASSNYFDYSNPDFDQAIADGNAAPSIEEANAKYQEAEQILAQDLPVVPLWIPSRPVVWSENVTNVAVTPFGVPDYSQVQVAGN